MKIITTVLLVLVFNTIGCSPNPKPEFFGLSLGQAYQSPIVTNCDANLTFETTPHDTNYTCQLTPATPNPLFTSYQADLSLKTKTLFRIIASTEAKSGCGNKEAVTVLLESKYGAGEYWNDGLAWEAPGGIYVHLTCAKVYISPKDMTPEQYASIHEHVERAEAYCFTNRAVNMQRCIDDNLVSDWFEALSDGNEWPTIDAHLSLSYFDENTERKVANPEYESLKRAYLKQHKDAKGL